MSKLSIPCVSCLAKDPLLILMLPSIALSDQNTGYRIQGQSTPKGLVTEESFSRAGHYDSKQISKEKVDCLNSCSSHHGTIFQDMKS